MESLRTVISRLFADTQDPSSTPLEDSNRRYCGYFSRKPSKRRRMSLLHPKTSQLNVDQSSLDDSPMVAFLLQTNRLDYDALASDFLRACVVGNMSEQLKVIMLKYREPPLTLVKATRLMAFLNHLLAIVPVTPKGDSANSGGGGGPGITGASTSGVYTGQAVTAAPTSTATAVAAAAAAASSLPPTLPAFMANMPFPLGQLFEDLTLTLSLRPTTPGNSSLTYSIWIVTIQFMLSCLRSNSTQALYNAGIATPAILRIIKHILLELTRLPETNMDALQKQCFSLGKQMLDLFLIREQQQQHQYPPSPIHHHHLNNST